MVEEERGRVGRGTGARGAEERPCVCGWVGELFRGNKPSSLERKKMSRMPVVNECKANVEVQQHPPEISETPTPHV